MRTKSERMSPWLRTLLLPLCGALVLAASALAQTQSPAVPVRVSPASVPRLGSYFSLHRTNIPPLPFLRPEYVELDLPVYWLGGSRFLVDDTSLDWAAIEAERRLAQAAAAAAQRNGSTPFETDGDGDPSILTDSEESTNSLRLTSPVLSGGGMSLDILGAAPDGVYDLYWHSLLGDATPYAHVARAQPGQTNFLLNAGTSPTGFLLLGTQLDSDGDGIPDAYENLVTKTDPHIANTAESLGTNAWLVQEVAPVVRNSEAFEIINRWTDRNPCQGQGTNQGQQAPALDNFFQTSRWHHAYGGTQTTVWVGLTCSNGTVVTNVNTTVVDWDASGSEPAKFAWSLSSVDGASNTTSLYWNHNVKRAVVTGGLPLSTDSWPWIVRGSASELVPTWDRPLQTSNSIPLTSISIAGKQLDTNGEAVVVFRDNTTNDITATVTGFTNYAYNADGSKVRVPLLFRNSGEITQRELNMVGYRLHGRICGSEWRFPAAGRRVRYAWRPAATRDGGSKAAAAARLPAAGKLVRLRRAVVGEHRECSSRCNILMPSEFRTGRSRWDPQILLTRRANKRTSTTPSLLSG